MSEPESTGSRPNEPEPGHGSEGTDVTAKTDASDATREVAPSDAEAREAAADEPSSSGPKSEEPEVGNASAESSQAAKRDRYFWHWVIGILLVLCIELYIYGRNGRIEVCVGVEGRTDWSLKGQPRTPETFNKTPFCAQRMNLGMYGDTSDLAEEALTEACSRATLSDRRAMPDCVRRDKKWTRKVEKEQIMPWDPRLYRRLLWID